jgi:hypothetical protein
MPAMRQRHEALKRQPPVHSRFAEEPATCARPSAVGAVCNHAAETRSRVIVKSAEHTQSVFRELGR